MLADMGIQVWFQRNVPQAPAASVPTPGAVAQAAHPPPPAVDKPGAEHAPAQAQSSAAPSAEIIEFSWLKNDQALIAFPLGADATAARMLKDILAYGSWLSDPGGKAVSGRVASGDFRWPQLVDSSGDPQRALRAFLDKQFAAQRARILLTAEVLPMLRDWLAELAGDMPLETVELPALQDGISDPASKKQIWQMMRGVR
jgi:hypothetical protein